MSNRRLPVELRTMTLGLVRANYADFGPTLAHEKLVEKHGLTLSIETLRKWMREDGLWKTRRERRKRAQQPRHRRACVGELVQIDGSDHEWFEQRGPRCTLLVYVDDATSRLQELRFAPESTFDYFESTRRYLEEHGKPVAFYRWIFVLSFPVVSTACDAHSHSDGQRSCYHISQRCSRRRQRVAWCERYSGWRGGPEPSAMSRWRCIIAHSF